MKEQESGLTFSSIPTNKKDLQLYCQSVREMTLSGDFDIVDAAKKINMRGRVVDFFEKDKEIQDLLVEDAMRYGKGERDDLQIREVGVRYDFSNCGHQVYNRLLEQKKEIEAYMKEIEATLKVRDVIETDAATGETFEAHKAAKTSTTKCVILIK